MGVSVALAIVLFTLGGNMGVGTLKIFIFKVTSLIKMNPWFTGLVGASILIGGSAIGKLVGGGRKMGDTRSISDMDRI